MLSISIPNRLPAASGKSAAGATLERLLAVSGNVRVTGAVPSSNSTVTRAVPSKADVFAIRM